MSKDYDSTDEEHRERNRRYQRKWYLKNKDKQIQRSQEQKKKYAARFRTYKATLEYEECGEDHPATLVFHHRNPKEKEFSIAKMAGTAGVAWHTLMKETEKCDVLCANCHRILHWEERHGPGPVR